MKKFPSEKREAVKKSVHGSVENVLCPEFGTKKSEHPVTTCGREKATKLDQARQRLYEERAFSYGVRNNSSESKS